MRTADREGDQVVAPPRGRVVGRFHEFAVAEQPVAGRVAREIEIGAECRAIPRPGFGHGDDRTRLGVALAEQQKIRRIGGGQDRKIDLHVTVRVA